MNSISITIVDYGMGNLRSVQNAIEHVGGHAIVTNNPDDLSSCEKIILPGVGAFGQAIDSLHSMGIAEALNEARKAGAQILGICLGMQLMCSESQEEGRHEGLGWFEAKVVPFVPKDDFFVPHVGWNSVDFHRNAPILNDLESGGDAYFVHGYHVQCVNEVDVLATTEYGHAFHSMIQRENLCGIQFHPEKSQGFGLAMIRNFLKT